jgi:hypothetical protein
MDPHYNRSALSNDGLVWWALPNAYHTLPKNLHLMGHCAGRVHVHVDSHECIRRNPETKRNVPNRHIPSRHTGCLYRRQHVYFQEPTSMETPRVLYTIGRCCCICLHVDSKQIFPCSSGLVDASYCSLQFLPSFQRCFCVVGFAFGIATPIVSYILLAGAVAFAFAYM